MQKGVPTEDALVVVPDANVLIHGKALPDLPWGELGRAAIEVLYVPTVVREIDQLKVQSGRANKIARQVSADVRALRKSEDKTAIVHEGSPRVTKRLIFQAISKRYHKSLKLDHADQALINYCLSLKAAGRDVLLLTNDTICATTADDVGLPALLVEDHWLRDAEPDERDRENARLKEELRKASLNEPQIQTLFAAIDGSPINSLEAEVMSWPALSRSQVSELLAEIEKGCPMATSFERPKEAASKALFQEISRLHSFGSRTIYTPPTETEIEAYKSRHYPDWLDAVHEKLEHLHEALEKRTRNGRSSLFSPRTKETDPQKAFLSRSSLWAI